MKRVVIDSREVFPVSAVTTVRPEDFAPLHCCDHEVSVDRGAPEGRLHHESVICGFGRTVVRKMLDEPRNYPELMDEYIRVIFHAW